MNKSSRNAWLAWSALVAMVIGLPVAGRLLFQRGPAGPAAATRITDDAGWPRTLIERRPDGSEARRVVLPAPPERIVSVTLATDEILLDLVDTQRIVALSSLAPKPGSLIADRVHGIPHFVDSDVESILALQPDLCFLASFNRQETRSLLADSGVPVYIFQQFDSLQDIRANLRTVGRAVAAEQQAERLLDEMDRRLASIAQRLPERRQWPSALAYSRSGWVSGTNTMQADLFQAAGLRSAAAEMGIDGFAQVSEEQVLEMDPDYLVVAAPDDEMGPQRQWLVTNPAFQPLRAVRQKQFLMLKDALFSTASHHVAEAAENLARQVYPQRFVDDQ